MRVVAFDTETYPIGPGEAVAPKIVCITWAWDGVSDIGAACEPATKARMVELLEDRDTVLVGHNVAYDLTCLARTWPDLLPLIFKKLEAHQITDTMIREKLINLSTHGRLESFEFHGVVKPIKYGLADLALNHLGKDRFSEKEDPESWRVRYHELDGIPASKYPEKALQYALEDAEDTLAVYEAQEQTHGSVETQFFRTAVAFALRMMTVAGMRIDREWRDRLAAKLAEEMAESNYPLLIDQDILRPARPPRPYKNGAVDPETGQPKMKAAVAASINKTALGMHIEEVCKDQGKEIPKTATGKVSSDEATIKELAEFSPALKEYQKRQEIARLSGTELPKLDADCVHPQYAELKETGRTSSYGARKGREALFPSTNIQQVDPRARGCFIPREGFYLCSCDYSSLELVSFAQKTYSLFGYSVHRDKVLAGYDMHSFLGAQLARRFSPEFSKLGITDPDEAYQVFMSFQKDDDEELRKFWKHWRTFAKPVGLGYPGGLGPDTMVGLAKAVYGIEIPLEQGEAAREVWHEIYPEAKDYFAWVNKQADKVDPDNYTYVTPLGMVRAGATYCACANGAALQSPAAEGATLAVFEVVREAWLGIGPLAGTIPLAFIHDEILADVPVETAHEAAHRIGEIMVDSMQKIMPDVKIEAQPCLMLRWDKRAEPVYENGRLIPWQPSPTDGV